ncbi:hypoxanthine phosphoribosyltransferase [Tropheryma whipplei]|uniref:hypoxanthine phosphoribosyltransferase n=1 Tax=Tropheryma whipplei TaxID=2039 RepID=UPI0004AEB217|nr:hypoxanthine phosphoribosyltransferase [Tropheryma whipplei]
MKPLLSEAVIHRRLAQLALQIDEDYRGTSIVLLGVLKGSIMLMADLSRLLSSDLRMEWVTLSSYGNDTVSSGSIRIVHDLDADIRDRHVLIIEDIVDSGLTLGWLLAKMRERRPASIEACVLLRKPHARGTDVRYLGFDIPDEFVIGYGMDYAEKYRNLKSVYVLEQ